MALALHSITSIYMRSNKKRAVVLYTSHCVKTLFLMKTTFFSGVVDQMPTLSGSKKKHEKTMGL